MNRKLKTALGHRFNHQSEQGFALPIAVGMGLIMLLVGTTMIVRSHGNQIAASAQKGSAQSLATTEGAIARTLSQLNRPNNRVLLTLDYDPDGLLKALKEAGESDTVNQWNGATSSSGGSSSCSSGSTGNPDIPFSTEQSIGSSGKYRIKAYRYNAGNPGTGTLLIEGKQGTTATSRVRVSIPVVSSSGNFPGLYAAFKVKLQNTNVINLPGTNGCGANVYCNPAGCSSPANPTTLAQKREAIEANANGQVDGGINIKTLTLPAFPADNWFDPGSGFPTGKGYYNLRAGNIPTSSGEIKQSYSLPRLTDITNILTGGPAADGFYHYRIGKIDMQGNALGNTLTIDTTIGKKVKLYVTEEITLGGSAQIRNTGKAGDLHIYVQRGKQIQIKGNSCIDGALVYGPETTLQAQGGGSGCTFNGAAVNANIKGAVWVREWDGNGNDMGIAVPGDIGSQLSDMIITGLSSSTYKLNDGIRRWQRQE